MKTSERPLLELRALSVGASTAAYTVTSADADAHVHRLLDRVSFELHAGERVAVLGSSGAGKSMLALALMGLLRPPLRVLSGAVHFAGEDLSTLSPRQHHRLRGSGLFMVAQSAGAWLDPLLRIGRQLDACARRSAHGRQGTQDTQGLAVAESLAAVALPATVVGRYAHQLSGGMKQRVLIAMALLLQPRLVIADEPTSGLDDDTAQEVLGALAAAQRRLRSSLLLVTHDLRWAQVFAERVLVLDDGRCVEDAAMGQFAAAPASAAGRALRDAAQQLQLPVQAP